MREIKFRGKRIDNGEWVYGYFVFCRKHYYILENYSSEIGFDERYQDWIEVGGNTVGQFTGFYDTINIKIYDGDIVDCEDVDSFGVVYWDNDDARYCILFNGTIYDFGDFTRSEIEVVSNIHDNPELLKQT